MNRPPATAVHADRPDLLERVGEAAVVQVYADGNRQMIVRWLMANTDAIDVRQRDGRTFYVLTSVAAFQEGVGRLLVEVQRIKSKGDYPAAKHLFDTYGVSFGPVLRDEVVARAGRLQLPSYTGFVMPKPQEVHGPNGEVADVIISYPLNLARQMLECSAATHDPRR